VRPGIACRIPQGVVEYGREPPWAHGPNDLFSAFSVGAEIGSYFNEEWPYPANIICTFAEMMTYHNIRLCKAAEGGKEVPGLIDALKYYNLLTIGAETKREMRELAIRGPPFTYEELVALIDYCEPDVMACRRLFWTMLKRGHIDLIRASIRARSWRGSREAFGVTAFPEDGGAMRKKCKESVLGGMYGLGAEALAYKHGISVAEARDLQAMVPRLYPVFDAWLKRVLNKARMGRTIYAALGWPIEIKGFDDRRGTYLNFPMQANGAEIMRLATIYIIDAGLELCAIIHDAFMILSPADRIDGDMSSLGECMRRASRVVLDGFELRLDPKVILHPHRYEADERSRQQWDDLIRRAEQREQQKWKS
jgi:DNA polymerase family A